MKILNFGSCNVDYVYSVEDIAKVGETVSSNKLELFPGGKGLNQSVALARSGEKVYHAGCVGCDGDFLLKLMQDSGVDISLIKRSTNKNGHAIIQLDKNGENSIIVYKGTNGENDFEYIDWVLEKFDKGDYLILQNEISNIFYIVKRGIEKGMRIVLNPSPFDNSLRSLDLGALEYLIVNKTEAEQLFGTSNAQDVFKIYSKKYSNLKVVLTLGANGSCLIDAKGVTYCPAYKIDVVDTVAAGDTFTGYFVSQTVKGNSSLESLKTASAAAGIAVSKKGAASSIPVMEEVVLVMKELTACSAKVGKSKMLAGKIVRYVENCISNASIEGLAKEIGYSSAYVGVLVKRVMGQNFSDFLQNKRLEKARTLLEETDLSITEIINVVGYENQGFFRKKFNEKYGKKPLEYRKEKQGEKL